MSSVPASTVPLAPLWTGDVPDVTVPRPSAARRCTGLNRCPMFCSPGESAEPFSDPLVEAFAVP